MLPMNDMESCYACEPMPISQDRKHMRAMKFMITIAKKVLNLLVTFLQDNNDRTKKKPNDQNHSYLITNKNNRGGFVSSPPK